MSLLHNDMTDVVEIRFHVRQGHDFYNVEPHLFGPNILRVNCNIWMAT